MFVILVNAFGEHGKEGCRINDELLNQLYHSYYREIYIYLYSMCRRHDLAEDLTQDTFLKAILSLSDNHGNMRAWLYTVARNLYFNHARKEKTLTTLEDISSDEEPHGSELLAEITRKDRDRLLHLAIEQLSTNKREVLIMHYFSGLSQKEIAQILGLTPSNVRVLTLRAKQELKRYLEVHDIDIS